ncbi:hypothetical protein BDQ17DRAFT_1371762 [Cyathus striatus]|nr:hypothetical protein BDQ17DRAFT_1371762 [Cyathus striatus]
MTFILPRLPAPCSSMQWQSMHAQLQNPFAGTSAKTTAIPAAPGYPTYESCIQPRQPSSGSSTNSSQNNIRAAPRQPSSTHSQSSMHSISHAKRTSRDTIPATNQTPARSSDSSHLGPPFYGNEDFSRTCSRFITRAFSCSEYIPPKKTRTFPSLPEFIAYVLRRTSMHYSVPIIALIYLDRLKLRFQDKTAKHGHRLFITAFILAAKFMCEEHYTNDEWVKVTMGMFRLAEINVMEREMLSALEWELGVDEDMVNGFHDTLWRDYGIVRGWEEYPGCYGEGVVRPKHCASAGPLMSNLSCLARKTEKNAAESFMDVSMDDSPSVVVETIDSGALESISFGIQKTELDWKWNPIDVKLKAQCFAYPAPCSW